MRLALLRPTTVRWMSSLTTFSPFFGRQMMQPLSVFDDAFPSLMERPIRDTKFFPKVDISESPKELTLKFEVPGMGKGDIEVEFKDGSLTVSGRKESHSEQKNEDDEVVYSETHSGAFTRSIALPQGTTDEDIVAKQEDGTLKITVAKHEEAQPESRKKLIDIQ